MNEQERAEEHLRTIRRLMERGTIYRAISAPSALVGGILSLAASALYPVWERPGAEGEMFPGGSRSFIWLWLLVLLLTAATNTLIIILGARRRREPVFSASMKAALTALTPSFLLAAIITICEGLDPGWDFGVGVVWATCYGLGLLATSHFAPRSLALLGWAFFLSGAAGILLAHFVISPGWSDSDDYSFGSHNPFPAAFFMAATFGLFHLIYALCAWPREGAPEP